MARPDARPSASRRLAQSLTANWQHRGLLARLLYPVSLIYLALIGLRQALYRAGIFKTRKLGVPVIVVGNVVSGGAGKTPTVISIVRHLQSQGLKPGVVSRGYGRKTDDCRPVLPGAAPQDVGDEPLLIVRATGAPVFVGPGRFEAGQSLLAQHPEVGVLVCDDGLQHYGLFRDIEVCVFDNRGIGNGWLIPAGPLRERWPRRLLTRAGQAEGCTLNLHTGSRPTLAGYTATRSLSLRALRSDGSAANLTELAKIAEKPLFAVAGIAQPQTFFDMLRALEVPLSGSLALADHDDFSTFDPELARQFTLLCTEKDAAKLWRVARDALAVPLLQTIEPAFFAALDSRLGQRPEAKLSSPHG